MRYRSVPVSEILAHPTLSLSPADYLNHPDTQVFNHSEFTPDEDDTRRDDADDTDWIDEVEGVEPDDDDFDDEEAFEGLDDEDIEDLERDDDGSEDDDFDDDEEA